MTSPETAEPKGSHHLLIVAADTVSGAQLRDAIADRVQGGDVKVKLIAPAMAESKLEHVMGGIDEAREKATERLAESKAELERAGLEVEASVGDADLKLAIQDALQTYPADEIVIVAHQEGGAAFERKWIEEAEHEFEPAITEIFVEHPDQGEAVVADVEEVPSGQERADAGEEEPESRNLPPFSPRDLLGIIVAIVGTLVLVVLAATGTDDLNDADGGGLSAQSARILIAGAVALINIAHVVGLVLFQAGPSRGGARTLFARMSLIGTPLAIAVSAILLATD